MQNVEIARTARAEHVSRYARSPPYARAHRRRSRDTRQKERAPHKAGHYGDVETEIGRSVGALAIVAKQAGAGSEVDKR